MGTLAIAAPRPAQGAGCPHPQASHSTLCRGIELAAEPRRRRALPGCPQDGLSCRIRPAAAPWIQVPTERIARRRLWRGCSAHGARPKPVAFRSLPRRVAALPCFSRFLVCVCVSGAGGGRQEGNQCREPRASLRSLLSLSPPRGPQRGDAQRHCGFAVRVPWCSCVLCCRSVVVPVNHSLLDRLA